MIASPVFHRWHQSRDLAAIDKSSAGPFPEWDILFVSSSIMPHGRAPKNFRNHEPMPKGYLRQLLDAFAARRWRRRLVRHDGGNPVRCGPLQASRSGSDGPDLQPRSVPCLPDVITVFS